MSSVRKTIYLPLIYKHLKLGEMPRRAHLSSTEVRDSLGSVAALHDDSSIQIF